MAIKDNIDFSTFTDSSTASDLYSNSIRRAFSYDSYGNKTKFTAVVLTNPIPVNPNDMRYFTGTSSKSSKKFDRFVYRARIIGNNSPHDFLPDPCDLTYAIDPDQALKVIEMHTLFISDTEFGSAESLPRINTVVEVELEKNSFGYNLQYGKHIKVSFNEDKPAAGTTVSCDSLKSIMDSATGGIAVSDFDDGENLGGPPLDDPQVEEIYNAYITKYGSDIAPPDGMCGNLPGYPLEKCKVGKIGTRTCTLHPTFFDKVKQMHDLVVSQKFDKTNSLEKINGGDTIRTVKKQISLRIQNAKKKGKVLGRKSNLNGLTKSKILEMKSQKIGLKKIAAETKIAVKTIRNFLKEVA